LNWQDMFSLWRGTSPDLDRCFEFLTISFKIQNFTSKTIRSGKGISDF
jgi:hypothetical protein